MELRNFLEQMSEFNRRHRETTKISSLRFCCLEEAVLHFGSEYTAKPRPKGFRRGTPKQCFYNSYRLVVNRPNLVYVEGFAFLKNFAGFPIHHAWAVETGSHEAIDVTSDNFSSYFGIAFQASYVKSCWRNHPDGVSLLDNYGDDYPILRMSDEEASSKIFVVNHK